MKIVETQVIAQENGWYKIIISLDIIENVEFYVKEALDVRTYDPNSKGDSKEDSTTCTTNYPF